MPDDARLLARVTCEGAARLLAESAEEAQDLRRKSPAPAARPRPPSASSTNSASEIVAAAVAAARDRGRELGK